MMTTAGMKQMPTFRLPLVFLATVAVVLLVVAARETVPVPVEADVLYTEHAEKHPEAVRIRRCLEERGADQVWRARSWRHPFKFYRSCQLPDGSVGLQIVKWSWRALAWREVTSFVVKNGTWRELVEYVSAQAELVAGRMP